MQKHVGKELKHIKLVGKHKVQTKPLRNIDATRLEHYLQKVAQYVDN